ncbi:DUF5357 family protein [Coleofasciculus sp. LEGE 07092]|uniref:DUF5357 family protein n=2 Tax=unclassified Coleofasciculus TaxID=2692782 RepID=UPI001D14FB6C|nr:DUF5357 family protein [Coleofasciculus sp. LEGE 07092]
MLDKYKPPKAFSWQTLILLNLFSWLMAWLATSLVQFLLIHLGWIFLIFGIYWWTSGNKLFKIGGFPLSPWIAGGVICGYIFGFILGNFLAAALILWPLISAVIAALPIILGSDLKLKMPPPEYRQALVWLFTSQFLLSCWFQFYFLTQDWLTEYPTILTDNFNRSAFVINVTPPPLSKERLPRGVTILDLMGSRIEEQLRNKPWSDVERSLLPSEREKLLNEMANEVRQEMASNEIEEDDLWQIGYNISLRDSGYNLELQAIWQGPRSQIQEYIISKPCQITQLNRQTDVGINTISQVKCEPARGWGVAEPIVATR